jgi:hypothetical protein
MNDSFVRPDRARLISAVPLEFPSLPLQATHHSQSTGIASVLRIFLTRIIREVITNDSQWCKVGYESR